MNNNIHVVYSDDFETLLKEEAEKAESMAILHTQSFIKFNKYSVFINIPVIVLSSLTGFFSVLNLFDDQAILLGLISILVGIFKTLDTYFEWTKRSETHRMVSLAYTKISKDIQLNLSLERNCRENPNILFGIINNDLQSIRDSEPIIGNDIIEWFKIKYKDEISAKPAITNGLTNIKINNKNIKEKEKHIEDKNKKSFKI